MNELYRARRDLVCDGAARDRRRGAARRTRTIYVWAPVPEGFASSEAYCEHVLERTGVVLTPGAVYGPAGRGLVSHLADHARRAPARGGGAARRARRLRFRETRERELRRTVAAPVTVRAGVREVLDWKWMDKTDRRSASNGRSAVTARPAEHPEGHRRAGNGSQRARQRAFCDRGAARRGRPRRAGRAAAHRRRGGRGGDGPAPRAAPPEHLSRPGQGGGGEGRGAGVRREPDRVRRRAERAPGAQPRGGAGPAGGRPHDRDPRHLRLARGQRGGQAPGRAGAAGVQPRAHARPVEPPRAPGRRHRHEGPGGDADRDRPAPGARPHRGAAPAPGAREGHARGAARRARARGAADDRARRLHQRRQVDAAERAHRRRGGRPRPPVPHARPDHAHAASWAAGRTC